MRDTTVLTSNRFEHQAANAFAETFDQSVRPFLFSALQWLCDQAGHAIEQSKPELFASHSQAACEIRDFLLLPNRLVIIELRRIAKPFGQAHAKVHRCLEARLYHASNAFACLQACTKSSF